MNSHSALMPATAVELANWPLAKIKELQDRVVADKANIDQTANIIKQAIAIKSGLEKPNIPGTTTIRPDKGGGMIKVVATKKVTWDGAKLAEVRQQIIDKWKDDPSQYIDMKLSVPENKFKGWPDALRQHFEAARTETIGRVTHEIVEI